MHKITFNIKNAQVESARISTIGADNASAPARSLAPMNSAR